MGTLSHWVITATIKTEQYQHTAILPEPTARESRQRRIIITPSTSHHQHAKYFIVIQSAVLTCQKCCQSKCLAGVYDSGHARREERTHSRTKRRRLYRSRDLTCQQTHSLSVELGMSALSRVTYPLSRVTYPRSCRRPQWWGIG